MLLSIDRVLQLLSEEKSIDKIAELAECKNDDVISIIDEARKIINKYEKPISKKKIKLKKHISGDQSNAQKNGPEITDEEISKLLSGAELSAVPLNSSLTMYIDGASTGNPGPSGIGVVIFDQDDRQVGKVSAYVGKGTNDYAEYTALIRALKIALYFNTRKLNIRTDSELIVKQLSGEYKVKTNNIKRLYETASELMSKIEKCKIEHVSRIFNEKADYLAKKGSEKHNEKRV